MGIDPFTYYCAFLYRASSLKIAIELRAGTFKLCQHATQLCSDALLIIVLCY